MESWFELDEAQKVGRWALQGRVTDEFFRESLRVVSETLVGLQMTAGIIDLSEVTSFEVTNETLRQVAMSSPVMPREMLRLVVVSEEQAAERAKLFAVMSETSRPNLFVVRSLAVAHHLLGIKEPRFKRVEKQPQS